MKIKGKFYAVALGVTCTAFGVSVGGLLAQAQGTSKPEVDHANATIQLGGTPLTSVTCKGEDKVVVTPGQPAVKTPYITYSGTWTGGETETPADLGESDYPLSGNLTVSNISWTINTFTDRGVLVGKAVLAPPTGATGGYSGKLVLVTQGLPSSTAAPATGRGYLVANFQGPDDGVVGTNDDYLVANVEFGQLNVAGGNGFFGDAPGAPAVPDFSVVTNTPPKGTEHC